MAECLAHNVELSFERKWLSASVDYDYVHKPMLHTFGLYDNQEIAYFSIHNMEHYQMLSAAVTASPTFSWYHPSWEIDYSQLFFREPTSLCSRHPSFTFVLRNSLSTSMATPTAMNRCGGLQDL